MQPLYTSTTKKKWNMLQNARCNKIFNIIVYTRVSIYRETLM